MVTISVSSALSETEALRKLSLLSPPYLRPSLSLFSFKWTFCPEYSGDFPFTFKNLAFFRHRSTLLCPSSEFLTVTLNPTHQESPFASYMDDLGLSSPSYLFAFPLSQYHGFYMATAAQFESTSDSHQKVHSLDLPNAAPLL